ncbi:MAG TPA: PAS domain S-box protein, partial [Bacillota bacterium]|nr:PAS domain S-box protein [Bacillota bacterium]
MIRRSRTVLPKRDREQSGQAPLSQQAQALELLPLFVRDGHDTVIYWSQGAQRLYGYSPEEALGHLSYQLLQTQFPEPLEHIRDRMREGRPWHGELAQVRKDGSRIYVASQWVSSRDPHTGLRTTIEVNTDITQHRLAEATHDQLAAIVESSEDAIIGKNLDGIITSWNAAAERMFGYRAHEAIGQFISLILPPELQAEEAIILERLRAGEHLESFETIRLTKDGRRLDVSLTISPVRDASGAIIGASKIVRDISRRKSAEAAARLAREMAHRRQVEQREQILSAMME